ncbi:MAG: ubiquinone/menaquinone biosynthesis methyltransferase [Gammaproteobacteria bacterium]|nr:ubiquinone/menaquinone biosynthesis methyltransferase [Gammaproteobacteria bacterium]
MTSGQSHRFAGEPLTPEERDRRIREIFVHLAPRYQHLCDFMTFGLHRYWRRLLAQAVQARAGQRILDVAGGGGESACLFAGPGHQVIVLDPSLPMMNEGRRRKGRHYVSWVGGVARRLPLADESVDTVTVAFGIRNITFVEEGLKEALRVLKPGGRFLCLEVSQPWGPLRPLYHAVLREMLPRVGAWIVNYPPAYSYLVESIEGFPDHDQLKRLLKAVGFSRLSYRDLSLGIACLHAAEKPRD